jgi:hypothetical protein
MVNAKLALGALLAVGVSAWGCGKPAAEPAQDLTANSVSHAGHNQVGHGHDRDDAVHDHAHADAGHDHGGWWCSEHRVPEEMCGLCDPQVAQKLKSEGDWCQAHDRPDSQCFVCHPEYAARFAALYEAKFGRPPE